jgi:hypothetical protein
MERTATPDNWVGIVEALRKLGGGTVRLTRGDYRPPRTGWSAGPTVRLIFDPGACILAP